MDKLLAPKVNNKVFFALFISGFFGVIIDYIIWRRYFLDADIYIRIGVSPLQFFILLFSLNLFIAFYAVKKKKELGYFLLFINIVLALLFFSLLILYLKHQ